MVQEAVAYTPEGDTGTGESVRLIRQLSLDELRPPSTRKPVGKFRRKLVDGTWLYRCTRCESWKPSAGFPTRPSRSWGVESQCRACMGEKQTRRRNNNRELARARQKRDYQDRVWRTREAARRAADSTPYFASRESILPFLERLVELYTNDGKYDAVGAAAAAKTTTRTLSAIRAGEREQVNFSIAENIAIAIDRLDEFMAMFPEPGLDGWSKAGHRYCQRCRRYDLVHWAKGLCRPCYRSYRNGMFSLESLADYVPTQREKKKKKRGWSAMRDYKRMMKNAA